MQEYSMDELDKRLGQLLDSELPASPTSDVNAALLVADLLESNGYTFQLKDMCPKSLCDNLWRAVFTYKDEEFVADNSESAFAICAAAVAALEGADAAGSVIVKH